MKGLSTFVVPKFMVNQDGSLGERNKLSCTSIEHKMGMHGSCTCSLPFEGATRLDGGQPNQGIQNMFVMMNPRAHHGRPAGPGPVRTGNAERRSAMRGTASRARPATASREIIEHADVRRMLLQMKATTEGARMLAYETGDVRRSLPTMHPMPQ